MTQPDSPIPQSASPSPQKPFAAQAAQFAFWGPIAVLIIGLGANGALSNKSGSSSDGMTGIAWMVIAGVNVLILLTSFVLGAVALIAAWRHNLKGIVGRTVVGMVISGLFLAGAAYVPFYMNGTREKVAARFIGEWHATVYPPGGPALDSTLILQSDRHATVRLAVGANSATRSGTWNFRMGNADHNSQFAIRWDPGQDSSLGDGVLWTVERIEEDQLTLVGKNADGSPSTEHYLRVKH